MVKGLKFPTSLKGKDQRTYQRRVLSSVSLRRSMSARNHWLVQCPEASSESEEEDENYEVRVKEKNKITAKG